MNKKPKLKKAELSKKRSLSRLMAVQILYQRDYFFDIPAERKNIDEITNDVIENYTLEPEEEVTSYRDKIDEEFVNNLVSGVIFNLENIDVEISEFLQEGWNIELLDETMRQILRLGTFELKFLTDVPLKVVIDEYVDIAASFFDNKRITFANAMLENLSKKLRSEEFEKIKIKK
jgi:N utilization substance protein B